MNGLTLSILLAKFERTIHDESHSHATNVESDYYYYSRNMEVHYSHKNVV